MYLCNGFFVYMCIGVRKIITIILFFSFAMMTKGQDSLSVAERNALQGFNDTIDRLAEDFIRVNLVVCDPGEVLYASFGHAMLRMQCPTFDLDYVFTYESEDIRYNWSRFLKGQLKMGMFAYNPNVFFELYRKDGRGVREYPLNLTPKQEQNLWRTLEQLAAQGADRPYDYYTHGCAISIVHVVKQALKGQPIEYGEWPAKFDGTLRELGYECVTKAQKPWNRFALMTLAGSDIDDPHISKEKKLIVPADLAEVWQHATIDGRPLLSNKAHVLVPSVPTNQQVGFTPLMVSAVLLVLALCSLATLWMPQRGLQILGEVIDYSVLVVVTFIGVIIGYTVFISTLPCTSWNWLIVPFNILPALAWPWRKYWALPWSIVIAVWCAVMTGKWLCGHIWVEWAHVVLAITFAIILMKQYSKKINLQNI